MKYVVFIFFLSVSFVRIDAQLVEELQVTYGDASRDTLSFVTGNRGNVPSFNLQNVKLSLVVDNSGLDTACDSVPADLSGTIALVDRGVCSLNDKYYNIAEKGAIGFIACNTSNSTVPQLGNFSDPALPTGAMNSSDCNLLRFKLDENSTVNWISEYLLDCTNEEETEISSCDNAEDLGEILECPLITFNTDDYTTYNSCPENIPSSSCFSEEYGSKWITFTTGPDMTSLNFILTSSTGAETFFEIYDTNGCGPSPTLITCLTGDSTHLVENLFPETTYQGLLGKQVKAAEGDVTIKITNAECKYKASGVVFHDLNNNGLKDVNEELLADIRFDHAKSIRFFITNEKGEYSTIFSPSSDTISLADEALCWAFRDSADMILLATNGEDQIKDIPLISTGDPNLGLSLQINASRPRCNSIATVIVKVKNEDCKNDSGIVEVKLDPSLKLIDTTGFSDVMDSSFTFTYNTLPASATSTISFKVAISDEFSEGKKISISASSDDIVATYSDFINCESNPNDIIVSPSRDNPNNYTLNNEIITYRIRFQNTGSDTVSKIVILGYIPPIFVINKVIVSGNSHDFIGILDQNDFRVTFENIDLVDSLTNEPESYGFFEYQVELIEGVEDFTIIENTARISFDGGEFFSTNTVQSTIVSTLDSDSDGSYFWEDCDDEDPRARPNGVELPNNDVDEDCDGIVEYFTVENCDILSEDFNNYQVGGFTSQTDGEWFLKSINSKDARIWDWGDGFKVLDIASDFNQSNTEYEAQVVQKLGLEEAENVSISFNYGNECGIIALELYADSTFTKFAEFVIDGYGENFDNPQYLIQGGSYDLCHGLGFFVNYTIDLNFTDNILTVECPNGSIILAPFYMEASSFYGIGWGSNQCAYISDLCISSVEAQMVDEDVDGYSLDIDCDDTDASINPGAEEIPNNDVDENCDGIALVIDDDIDGFNSSIDCDDNNPLINPQAEEIPNNDIDENCDGEISIIDVDQDSFNSDVDCDDTNADINPDAEDIPNNGIDENCDGEDVMSSAIEQELINVSIFPNPLTRSLNIELDQDNYSVQIFNVIGEQVYSNLNVSNLLTIEAENWIRGMYFIKVTSLSTDGRSIFKLMKI